MQCAAARSSTMDGQLILCVGICCLDVIHVCDEYPAEDSDRRSAHGRWQRGGNPSNNCTVLALLGERCEYLGTFSRDVMFGPVLHDFQTRGISTRNCVFHDNTEIPLSSVILSLATGSRTIVHSNPNLPELTSDDFRRCDLTEYKWIHFEPRTEHVRDMMAMTAQWNVEHDDRQIIISLELEKPKKHPLDYAELANVLFISQVYAEDVLEATTMQEAVQYARDRIANKSIKMICAWGAKGAAALDSDQHTEPIVAPAHPPSTIVDTLGAGDTFCGATIFALANNKSLLDAITFGNKVAGAKIGFHGYDHIKDVYQAFFQ